MCRGLLRQGATFKAAPPMLYRLAYGQSLQIVRIVDVAALSLIQLTRLATYSLKSSSLVLVKREPVGVGRCPVLRSLGGVRAGVERGMPRRR
jgi:hypothetical protein